MDESANKMWYNFTMEYYPAIKGNEVLIHPTPWKYDPKRKKPNTKRYVLYDFTYMKCIEWENLVRKYINVFQGHGDVGNGEWLPAGVGFLFGVMKMFWN